LNCHWAFIAAKDHSRGGEWPFSVGIFCHWAFIAAKDPLAIEDVSAPLGGYFAVLWTSRVWDAHRKSPFTPAPLPPPLLLAKGISIH